MKHLFIAIAVILVASSAQAKSHKPIPKSDDSDVVVWDKDSKDPNIGWHTENGIRVCRHDCDNPEITGSGARCHNVTVMGMRMHEHRRHQAADGCDCGLRSNRS